MQKIPIAVLVSGSGTNLQALIDASTHQQYPAEIKLVISNKRSAFGLERARQAGIENVWISHRQRSREDFEHELISTLQEHKIKWVVLAGFMRILTSKFINEYPLRVLNIHPSLLPSFPGMNAQQQAWDAGVTVSGATVHFVDAGMDTGPIIAQKAVSIGSCSSVEEVKEQILSAEHQLYPAVIKCAVLNLLSIEAGRVRGFVPD